MTPRQKREAQLRKECAEMRDEKQIPAIAVREAFILLRQAIDTDHVLRGELTARLFGYLNGANVTGDSQRRETCRRAVDILFSPPHGPA